MAGTGGRGTGLIDSRVARFALINWDLIEWLSDDDDNSSSDSSSSGGVTSSRLETWGNLDGMVINMDTGRKCDKEVLFSFCLSPQKRGQAGERLEWNFPADESR